MVNEVVREKETSQLEISIIPNLLPDMACGGFFTSTMTR